MEAIEAFIIKEILTWLADRLAKYFEKQSEIAASDHAIDQHAKDVADEMASTTDPGKMDQADDDLLSGR